MFFNFSEFLEIEDDNQASITWTEERKWLNTLLKYNIFFFNN